MPSVASDRLEATGSPSLALGSERFRRSPGGENAEDLLDQPVERLFRERILAPYKAKGCVYLKEARHSFFAKRFVSRAHFSIAESCYIDSTGHFNAVELNICSNQLFYLLWADVIRRERSSAVQHWRQEDFSEAQLPKMLIVRLNSNFRRAIDATNFYAEGAIEQVRVLAEGKMAFVRGWAKFWDDNDGLAKCEIDWALL